MNVVDASAWIEYFVDGANAYYFAPAIEETELLLVPASTMLDVFYAILRRRGDADALKAAAIMQQGTLVVLDGPLALSAAKIRADMGLPVLTSIALATAIAHGATLWTQDERLANVPKIRYVRKRKLTRSRK